MPPPPTSINVAVIVVPYNGYGCIDTLYTDITNNLVITANAGKDTVSCNRNPVPIGSTPQLNVDYQWLPTEGLSNPTIANPLALPDTTTTYVLTARSKGGGCLTIDSVVVKAYSSDNSIQLLGKTNYCIGSGDSTVLIVKKTDSIQWYKNGLPIIGANDTVLHITETGTYQAILFGPFGCNVTTPSYDVNISSIPVSGFTVNNPIQCLVGNEFIFTNNSTNNVGDMHYKWILSDGTFAQTRHLTHKFTKAGTYSIKLIVNSSDICADSTEQTIVVNQNAVANFSVKTSYINLPVDIVNTTADTLGSTINYLWTFPNGQTSTLRNPPSQTFAISGIYNFTLAVYSNQCPTPIHSLKRPVLIEKPKSNINYPLEYAVVNMPLNLQARNFGETYLWRPAVNLNNAQIADPVFKGNTEQLYAIDITTKSGCVTTDTQIVKLVKNIQVFVPNAFTPNGDNVNDVLKPVMYGIKQIKSFKIFNRWGQLFYQTATLKQGWDGYVKGVLQETQTIVWFIEALGADEKIYSWKGSSVLIR
ncbi:MAG: gliding motility-associated C-terminal domain-containing protein [Chitinophagaceae bacterium]|nr:gliding motility-associated C-terminal domain-containing protein [Chitinophagaceae bacterium]